MALPRALSGPGRWFLLAGVLKVLLLAQLHTPSAASFALLGTSMQRRKAVPACICTCVRASWRCDVRRHCSTRWTYDPAGDLAGSAWCEVHYNLGHCSHIPASHCNSRYALTLCCRPDSPSSPQGLPMYQKQLWSAAGCRSAGRSLWLCACLSCCLSQAACCLGGALQFLLLLLQSQFFSQPTSGAACSPRAPAPSPADLAESQQAAAREASRRAAAATPRTAAEADEILRLSDQRRAQRQHPRPS